MATVALDGNEAVLIDRSTPPLALACSITASLLSSCLCPFCALTIMTSFIGRFPVSVVFDTDSSCCLVSIPVAHELGRSAPLPGFRFSEILTASYDGRALTTDVEFEVVRSLDCDVLIGVNWIAAWRAVGREYEHPVHNPYSRRASGLQGDSTSPLNPCYLSDLVLCF